MFESPDQDAEVDGVDVGSYEDFYAFRYAVAQRLEQGQWGSRFPVLMSHSDSDGEWSAQEAVLLARELRSIQSAFGNMPPQDFAADSWQREAARASGLTPTSLAESFIDVDGELLLERLRRLADIAFDRRCPISFQ